MWSYLITGEQARLEVHERGGADDDRVGGSGGGSRGQLYLLYCDSFVNVVMPLISNGIKSAASHVFLFRVHLFRRVSGIFLVLVPIKLFCYFFIFMTFPRHLLIIFSFLNGYDLTSDLVHIHVHYGMWCVVLGGPPDPYDMMGMDPRGPRGGDFGGGPRSRSRYMDMMRYREEMRDMMMDPMLEDMMDMEMEMDMMYGDPHDM